MPTVTPQAQYWLLTIPHHEFLPYLPPNCKYIKGQLEKGNNTEYLHWQVIAMFTRKVRLSTVKETFGRQCHAEPSKSAAANDYVWKEDTRVANTQFELGEPPIRRNRKNDWNEILECARKGNFDSIPADVYIRYYNNIQRIAAQHATPEAIEKEVFVLWGPTGVGKSRRAWSEASLDAYPKDPRTKFWDGYRGHEHVVIDEFRGGIDIAHMLRWLDRYPVLVEVKGSSTVLKAKKIWITSNLDPRNWYPLLDDETKEALLRRLTITYCPLPLYNNE